jgi:hypothetical protein
MGVGEMRLSEAIFRSNSTRYQAFIEEVRRSRLEAESEVHAREGFAIPTYAQLTKVSVITPHRSRPTRREYNVKAALFQGMTANDPVIRPGQIVWVPSTFDKRIILFSQRVIAPIAAVGEMDAEASGWYGRITGNRVKGIVPKSYQHNSSEGSE